MTFSRAVFALEALGSRWQGPVQSSYGWHLVLLVKKEYAAAYVPEFEEVSSAVFADAQRQQQRADQASGYR